MYWGYKNFWQLICPISLQNSAEILQNLTENSQNMATTQQKMDKIRWIGDSLACVP